MASICGSYSAQDYPRVYVPSDLRRLQKPFERTHLSQFEFLTSSDVGQCIPSSELLSNRCVHAVYNRNGGSFCANWKCSLCYEHMYRVYVLFHTVVCEKDISTFWKYVYTPYRTEEVHNMWWKNVKDNDVHNKLSKQEMKDTVFPWCVLNSLVSHAKKKTEYNTNKKEIEYSTSLSHVYHYIMSDSVDRTQIETLLLQACPRNIKHIPSLSISITQMTLCKLLWLGNITRPGLFDCLVSIVGIPVLCALPLQCTILVQEPLQLKKNQPYGVNVRSMARVQVTNHDMARPQGKQIGQYQRKKMKVHHPNQSMQHSLVHLTATVANTQATMKPVVTQKGYSTSLHNTPAILALPTISLTSCIPAALRSPHITILHRLIGIGGLWIVSGHTMEAVKVDMSVKKSHNPTNSNNIYQKLALTEPTLRSARSPPNATGSTHELACAAQYFALQRAGLIPRNRIFLKKSLCKPPYVSVQPSKLTIPAPARTTTWVFKYTHWVVALPLAPQTMSLCAWVVLATILKSCINIHTKILDIPTWQTLPSACAQVLAQEQEYQTTAHIQTPPNMTGKQLSKLHVSFVELLNNHQTTDYRLWMYQCLPRKYCMRQDTSQKELIDNFVPLSVLQDILTTFLRKLVPTSLFAKQTDAVISQLVTVCLASVPVTHTQISHTVSPLSIPWLPRKDNVLVKTAIVAFLYDQQLLPFFSHNFYMAPSFRGISESIYTRTTWTSILHHSVESCKSRYQQLSHKEVSILQQEKLSYGGAWNTNIAYTKIKLKKDSIRILCNHSRAVSLQPSMADMLRRQEALSQQHCKVSYNRALGNLLPVLRAVELYSNLVKTNKYVEGIVAQCTKMVDFIDTFLTDLAVQLKVTQNKTTNAPQHTVYSVCENLQKENSCKEWIQRIIPTQYICNNNNNTSENTMHSKLHCILCKQYIPCETSLPTEMYAHLRELDTITVDTHNYQKLFHTQPCITKTQLKPKGSSVEGPIDAVRQILRFNSEVLDKVSTSKSSSDKNHSPKDVENVIYKDIAVTPRDKGQLYICTVDIKQCYDTIDREKQTSIVNNMYLHERYYVFPHKQMKHSNQVMGNKSYVALPSDNIQFTNINVSSVRENFNNDEDDNNDSINNNENTNINHTLPMVPSNIQLQAKALTSLILQHFTSSNTFPIFQDILCSSCSISGVFIVQTLCQAQEHFFATALTEEHFDFVKIVDQERLQLANVCMALGLIHHGIRKEQYRNQQHGTSNNIPYTQYIPSEQDADINSSNNNKEKMSFTKENLLDINVDIVRQATDQDNHAKYLQDNIQYGYTHCATYTRMNQHGYIYSPSSIKWGTPTTYIQHQHVDMVKRHLHDQLYKHTLIMGKQFLQQKQGIPQGSTLSPWLADIFIGHMEQHQIVPEILQVVHNEYQRQYLEKQNYTPLFKIQRKMDDICLISDCPIVCAAFLSALSDLSSYALAINQSKVHSNFAWKSSHVEHEASDQVHWIGFCLRDVGSFIRVTADQTRLQKVNIKNNTLHHSVFQLSVARIESGLRFFLNANITRCLGGGVLPSSTEQTYRNKQVLSIATNIYQAAFTTACKFIELVKRGYTVDQTLPILKAFPPYVYAHKRVDQCTSVIFICTTIVKRLVHHHAEMETIGIYLSVHGQLDAFTLLLYPYISQHFSTSIHNNSFIYMLECIFTCTSHQKKQMQGLFGIAVTLYLFSQRPKPTYCKQFPKQFQLLCNSSYIELFLYNYSRNQSTAENNSLESQLLTLIRQDCKEMYA